jgi:plastocyanin
MSASRLVLFLGVLALATACGSSNSATPSSPTPTPTPTTPAASGSTVSIPQGAQTMGAAGFNPNPITVAVGTTVTWNNNDTTAHTVTSNTGAFDSGPLGGGRTFSFTFQTAGTYQYHCTFHAGMVGSVVVQ